jgi:steroid delta-isomerase-like uncharacterized protein
VPDLAGHRAQEADVDATRSNEPRSSELRLNDFGSRYAQAWCSHDPDAVAAFYSVDGSLTVNDGEGAVGREAIAGTARGFMSDFPDIVVTMDRMAVTDQGTIFGWTLTGTNRGPGGTGKRVRISGYEVWQLDPDGLIAESQGHYDVAEYARQLEHGVHGAEEQGRS